MAAHDVPAAPEWGRHSTGVNRWNIGRAGSASPQRGRHSLGEERCSTGGVSPPSGASARGRGSETTGSRRWQAECHPFGVNGGECLRRRSAPALVLRRRSGSVDRRRTVSRRPRTRCPGSSRMGAALPLPPVSTGGMLVAHDPQAPNGGDTPITVSGCRGDGLSSDAHNK
jgi:hypothetical protein